MDWKVFRTNRNFQIVTFKDRYGLECSLQCSSVILDYEDSWDRPGTSAVWLGVDENRMELDREQVRTLTEYLTHWLEHGTFKEDVPYPAEES